MNVNVLLITDTKGTNRFVSPPPSPSPIDGEGRRRVPPSMGREGGDVPVN